MRVFLGDDTGLVKAVSVEKSSIVEKWGKQEKANEVLAMAFADAAEGEVRGTRRVERGMSRERNERRGGSLRGESEERRRKGKR